MRTRFSSRPADDNPARLYLATLSPTTHGSTRHALRTIAALLSDEVFDVEEFPWWEVRYRDAAEVRSALVKRYTPATVNKMLGALRGVLKHAWRLRYIDAETYHRAIAIDNVSVESLISGRALARWELEALFAACADDPSTAGRRDAAMLAVLYGCGVRRAELTGLDLADFDYAACSIKVRNGKRRKQRTVYLTQRGCRLIKAWIHERGTESGPLFCRIRRASGIQIIRLGGESVAYILRRRQKQAGTPPFSPHDIRRSFVSDLLDAGVDVLTVQRLAGHASANTTARYDRRGEDTKRRAAQRLELPRPRKPPENVATDRHRSADRPSAKDA